MSDEELFTLLRSYITANLADYGFTSVEVIQRYQPESGGVPTSACVLMYKIGDKRYGYSGESDSYDPEESEYIHTHEQNMESTFQFSALNPIVEEATASDILNAVADMLQTTQAVEYFQDAGVAVLRVTDIRNTFFVDDMDRHESDPSFDFTVLHKRVKMSKYPQVIAYDANIKRV